MPTDRSPFTLRAALGRQAVLAIAMPALVAILAIGTLWSVPIAGALLAALLVGLATARALLPVRAVGALAVRHRVIDVAVLLGLAVGLGVLSLSPNL